MNIQYFTNVSIKPYQSLVKTRIKHMIVYSTVLLLASFGYYPKLRSFLKYLTSNLVRTGAMVFGWVITFVWDHLGSIEFMKPCVVVLTQFDGCSTPHANMHKLTQN